MASLPGGFIARATPHHPRPERVHFSVYIPPPVVSPATSVKPTAPA